MRFYKQIHTLAQFLTWMVSQGNSDLAQWWSTARQEESKP